MTEKPKEEIESSVQNAELDEKAHASGQRIQETEMPPTPIQGKIKWEMARTITSKRNKRKPN